MNHFWPNDEALCGFREAQPGQAAGQSSEPQTGAPFLTRIEQVLGEEAAPDAAFFVDSWTVGVAAASENFLRKQGKSRSCGQEIPAWHTLSSFTPWYVAGVDASGEASWLRTDAAAKEAPIEDLRQSAGEEVNDRQVADDLEMVCSLTPESARKVLGVAATSTREQIRAAYRKMASRYHPDRLAQSGAGEQKLAGERMASINQAYRLLCVGLAVDRLARS